MSAKDDYEDGKKWGWEGPRPDGLIGTDFRRFANAVGRKLEAEHKQREAKEREADAIRKEIAPRTYFLAVRHIIGRMGDPVEIETCETLPVVGRMRATGRTYDHAVSNLYYGIAQMLDKGGYAADWEDARGLAVERFSFLVSAADSVKV